MKIRRRKWRPTIGSVPLRWDGGHDATHLQKNANVWAPPAPRSLLKISFTRRVDYSKGPHALLFWIPIGHHRRQPRVGTAASRALRSQFRNPDQVEDRAAEHEQPIYLRQPAEFHLLQRPNLLQPSERLFHQPSFA